MPTISMTRRHDFTHQEAVRRLEHYLTGQAREGGTKVHAHHEEHGIRRIEFHHPRVVGTAEIHEHGSDTDVKINLKFAGHPVHAWVRFEDGHLSLEAKLPLVAHLFKGRIERELAAWIAAALKA